jgi:hypothetical protein
VTLGVWLAVADVRVARALRSQCLFRLRLTLFAVTGDVLACGVLSGAVTENEADVQRMRAVVPPPYVHVIRLLWRHHRHRDGAV